MKKTTPTILIMAIGGQCFGAISVNVPLYHWSYAAVDKLAGYGLIGSAMLDTKPFSRLEVARLIREAEEKAAEQDEKNPIIVGLLNRLRQEFKFELDLVGSVRSGGSTEYVKPVEDPYLRFIYGQKPFDLENESGDRFEKGGNTRLGFAGRANLFDRVALYIHPEYESPCPADGGITSIGVKAVEAYGKTAFGGLEIEVGKDSLWWGPGYHGSQILGNNAENFTMLKVSNPEPVQLPWLLGRLGPFKATYFLTMLEENREHPHTRLTGIRLSVKPHPDIELGGSRTMMFGGEGSPSIGLDDYLDVFVPRDYLRRNMNQLATIDASWLVRLPAAVPARSARVYVDCTGEDADGFVKYRPLLGLQVNDLFKTGRTDLRIEVANNHVGQSANVFYNHSFYTSGYTYNGRVIGHHMGTDSEDLFVRVTHDLSSDLALGIDFDRQRANLSGEPRPVASRYGADLLWFAPHNWQIRAAYRYEQTDTDSVSEKNNIFDLSLIYNF